MFAGFTAHSGLPWRCTRGTLFNCLHGNAPQLGAAARSHLVELGSWRALASPHTLACILFDCLHENAPQLGAAAGSHLVELGLCVPKVVVQLPSRGCVAQELGVAQQQLQRFCAGQRLRRRGAVFALTRGEGLGAPLPCTRSSGDAPRAMGPSLLALCVQR